MLNQTNNFQNSEFKNSTAVDNNNAHVNNQNNNFQNSENGTRQNFNGANIANQNNYFFIFNLDWIFKSFNNKKLNTKQFTFLLFSRTILFVLLIGFILLPLYSVNKNNISIFEFACMIIGFIFLCSWYWARIKEEEPEASI